MNKSFYYYNCYITVNGVKTNFHLTDLIDFIRLTPINNREKFVKKKYLSLLNMKEPLENSNDVNDRKFVIADFRSDKPFLGNRGTDRLDEILDDVIEATSVFYQRNNRLLIIEYNHGGARPAAVQDYLSRFFDNSNPDSNNHFDVILQPIEPNLGFEDIANSNDIKEVILKLDVTANARNIYSEYVYNSILGDVIHRTLESHADFGANVAFVGFGNGRKKNDKINAESLINLLRGLNYESEVFESAKVKYVSPTTHRTEMVDIKNAGVLKQVHNLENNGWESITDFLEQYFYENGRVGQGQYDNNLIAHERPVFGR